MCRVQETPPGGDGADRRAGVQRVPQVAAERLRAAALRIQLATVVPDSWKTLCRCRVEMKCAAAMLAGDSCGSDRLASMYSRTDTASSACGFIRSGAMSISECSMVDTRSRALAASRDPLGPLRTSRFAASCAMNGPTMPVRPLPPAMPHRRKLAHVVRAAATVRRAGTSPPSSGPAPRRPACRAGWCRRWRGRRGAGRPRGCPG